MRTIGILIVAGVAGLALVEVTLDVAFGEHDLSDKLAAVATAMSNAMPLLGLKLNSQKSPVEMLAIDHAEEPSHD